MRRRILVDTNIFLTLLAEDDPSSQVIDSFAKSEWSFNFSHVSAWEISIKYGTGKLKLPAKPELFVPERVRLAGFIHLGIELEHVLAVHSLPLLHRDPFDRLLISQALIEDIPVLTEDKLFSDYGVTIMSVSDL